MSKEPTRKDKTCLNCNHVVDLRYCPNCGQENTNTRKTFHHLFIHFFEDLTHYENAFWKTIRNLLFKPAALTKEYLSGKRLSYLAPVRLYIFISIITFFLIAVIPSKEDSDSGLLKVKETEKKEKGFSTRFSNQYEAERIKDSIRKDSIAKAKIDLMKDKGLLTAQQADTIRKKVATQKTKGNKSNFSFGYDTMEEMDSIRKADPTKISDFEYWVNKKTIPVTQKYTNEELMDKIMEDAERNFPKTLFIYMPLFAFVLWLLHNKRKWYYFDHGIFTLHYFSFLLLIALLLFLVNTLFDYCGDLMAFSFVQVIINIIGWVWMVYYFFPAHHRFYGESRMVSLVKSCFIGFVNLILFTIILFFFFVYTFINIH